MAKTIVNIIDDQLVITVDIESVKFQIENHPYGFKILDDNKFMKYLEKNIDTVNYDVESGGYGLERLFDDLALQAYENCEEFIVTIDDED